jgi:galactokinase
MDQMASVLSRSGHALFLDTRTLEYEHVPFDSSRAGLAVAVIDTRTPRELVDGAYAERRASCERVSRALGVKALRDARLDGVMSADLDVSDSDRRRARHVVTENERVLSAVRCLRAGDWPALGELLTASHDSLRDDFEVSTRSLDTAVEAALATGAIGARMTGAGFGGCAIALLPTENVSQLESRARLLARERGLNEPEVLLVAAEQGARRVR